MLDERKINYRYAWWTTPQLTIALWGGGSVILIGGLWPILISYGVSKHSEIEDGEYDLNRFGAGETSSAHRTKLADENDQYLRDLDAELEAAAALGSGSAETKTQDIAVPLTLTPSDAEASSPPPPEPQHHYRGQYYPVDLPEQPVKEDRRSDRCTEA